MAGGMQKKLRFGVVLVACLVALSQLSSAATTSHTVGDSTGWTIPSTPSLYSTWAAKQTFQVGDTLVFNFVPGTHTVAEVSKSDYDSCTTANGALSPDPAGPAEMIIGTAGTHYYICTIPGHCRYGQKLAITTTTASSAAAPSTPSSSSSSEPPSGAATSPVSPPSKAVEPINSITAPPLSSAATLASVGLLIPFLLTLVAFLF